MDRARIRNVQWVLAATLVVASQASAQTEVGAVAAVVGSLQMQRGGTWQDASIGVPVFAGDHLRTGDSDQAKIVFRDDTVLHLGPKTEMSLEKQTFEPNTHRFETLHHLAKGKVRAWVSEYYHEPRARYEIETPTAVAGVRGTEFIVMYDASAEFTDIVGLAETVEVGGKLSVIGTLVQVGPQYSTRVRKGQFPTAPQQVDESHLRPYVEGLDIIGTGRRDSLVVQHPVVAGRLLAAQDLPGPPSTAATEVPNEGLGTRAPQEFLAARSSPDVRANTQPLLDFSRTCAGCVPSGSVRVGF